MERQRLVFAVRSRLPGDAWNWAAWWVAGEHRNPLEKQSRMAQFGVIAYLGPKAKRKGHKRGVMFPELSRLRRTSNPGNDPSEANQPHLAKCA